MNKIVVGSRGSKLAVVQTRWLLDRLKAARPGIDFELKIIKTKGDHIQHMALDAIGGKGLFTKELEDELREGTIAMAVHSMKDMPAAMPQGLTLAAPPQREDPSDVLVTPHNVAGIAALRKGAVIATGSKRRAYQLTRIRPDIQIVGIRGNVDTRLRKMKEQKLDGIILAAAGMRRIGVYTSDAYHCTPLDPADFICAPAQGILAVEIREDNAPVADLIASVCDERARIQMQAERGFLTALDGDCHLPIGAYCEMDGPEIRLHGMYGDEDGQKLVRDSITGPAAEAETLGQKLALQLKEQVDE